MAIIPIDSVGAVGVVSDLPSRELPPEAWSFVKNVRFYDGQAERSFSYAQTFGTPGIAPQFAIPVRIAGVNNWVYANGSAIYRTDGVTHTDITRTASPYAGGAYSQWTGCVLGGVLLLNNSGGADYPQQWDGGTGKMKDLVNWPANTYAKVLRSFMQFAVALNITDAGGNKPYTILWSHPADPGTVPSSWDITDATKEAGDVPASETEDILIDCLPMGNINYIFKERSIWTMQYIGGQQIFAFDKLFDNVGILAANCAVNTPSGQLVVTRGDVILHDGNSFQSIISKRVRKELFNTMSQEYSNYTRVALNFKFNEVWIFYATTGQSVPYANRALVWNWETGTWTFVDVPNVAYAANGVYPQVIAAKTWDTVSGTWDAQIQAWDQSEFPTAEDRMLLCDAANSKFYLADQGLTFDGAAYASVLERTGLGIVGRDRAGNWKVNSEAVKFIRNIYPKIDADPGVLINIYIGEQLKQNDPILWQGPFQFDPSVDTKIDCTITTKLIAVRFETTGSSFWRMYGYDIDMDVTARY